MSSATSALPDATARPAPITDEPTYSGCANQRYGPDDVTSRDLLRCPAAQTRNASPNTAIAVPASSASGVGWASHNTSAPKTNPSITRLRARASMKPAAESASCERGDPLPAPERPGGRSLPTTARSQATLDRRQHLGHLDVDQAHAI